MSTEIRILSVDYGDVRTGLAVSDPSGIIVTPLPVIKKTELAELIDAIHEVVEDHEVGKLIVGLPLRLDGSVGSRAEKTRIFIEQLKKSLNIPVLEWDERLTTAAADEILKASGMNWRKRKKHIDSTAAVLLLRSYLSAQP